VTELGYDAAVIRDAEGSLDEQLARVAPAGIDVCLDTVGGDQLRTAVAAAREGARILVLGALSGQLAPSGTRRTAPVTLDSFQILLKKITLRGYRADDDPDVREDWTKLFAQWLSAGQITFPHARIPGIANAPQALLDAMHGRHLGMTILEP
jgi:NADPH-dependent curcumin reductase CurA